MKEISFIIAWFYLVVNIVYMGAPMKLARQAESVVYTGIEIPVEQFYYVPLPEKPAFGIAKASFSKSKKTKQGNQKLYIDLEVLKKYQVFTEEELREILEEWGYRQKRDINHKTYLRVSYVQRLMRKRGVYDIFGVYEAHIGGIGYEAVVSNLNFAYRTQAMLERGAAFRSSVQSNNEAVDRATFYLVDMDKYLTDINERDGLQGKVGLVLWAIALRLFKETILAMVLYWFMIKISKWAIEIS